MSENVLIPCDNFSCNKISKKIEFFNIARPALLNTVVELW